MPGRWLSALLVLGGLAVCALTRASTIYVDPLWGQDEWSGISAQISEPNGPKRTLQAAINAAVDGDLILAEEGTYSGAGNHNLQFGAGLAAGQSRAVTLRAVGPAGLTVIDCGLAGRAFVFDRGETPATVVEGFTILNGVGGAELLTDTLHTAGGAVFCRGSSPTIRDCHFQGNQADVGGAVCLAQGSNSLLENCRFENNSSAILGGGLFILNSSPRISNCQFVENTSVNGAGIYLSLGGGDGAAISGCTLRGNKTQLFGPGGGIFLTGSSLTVQVDHCVISGNQAGEGGGICAYDALAVPILNCTIVGNRAMMGGGLRGQHSYFQLNSSILWQNQAMLGPQLRLSEPSACAAIGYCDIQGGIIPEDICAEAVVQENLDVDPLFAQPGVWDDSGTPDDESDDSWLEGDYHPQSTAGRWDRDFYRSGDLQPDGRVNLRDFAKFAAAWDQGGAPEADLDKGGTLDEADLALLARSWLGGSVNGAWRTDGQNSPAVDAGDPAYDPAADQEIWPDGGRIDLGAYGGTTEASLSPDLGGNAADLNRDTNIDIIDLLTLMEDWLANTPLLRSDLDRSGRVDLLDFNLVARSWPAGAEAPAPESSIFLPDQGVRN